MQAISISKSVRDFLAQPRSGTLIATFERSCYLDLDGKIVALVGQPLLNGPLNIVVAPPEPPFQEWQIGWTARADQTTLQLKDSIEITLASAQVWDARFTPWSSLEEPDLRANLRVVRTTLLREAPQGSFAHYLPHFREQGTGNREHDHLRHRAHDGITLLQTGFRERAREQVAAAARALAGLGVGLTPSGDDVLVGALIALNLLASREPMDFRQTIADTVAGLTTRISAAYVDATARGEASEAWHRLLAVLQKSDRTQVVDAARKLMAFGETSGADMLAGFLLAIDALLEGRR